MTINRAIILGGGSSLSTGIKMGLDSKLEGEFVIGCNEAYKDFTNISITTFVDKPFYDSHSQELKPLPLVICKRHGDIKQKEYPNFIMLESTNEYKQMDKTKIYSSVLVGIYSMSIAKMFCNEIFALGFDWTQTHTCKDYVDGKALTHYYQKDKERKHRGYGLTGFYDSHLPDEYFMPFAKSGINVYNVSLQSNINTFPKISYDTFFEQLSQNKIHHNQDELRQHIKTFFKG